MSLLPRPSTVSRIWQIPHDCVKLAAAQAPAQQEWKRIVLPLISERRSEIADLCRRFGVRQLAVFGSAARGSDFDPERSDVDFVVAFEQIDAVSLERFLALRDALSATVGRPVDLVMEGSVRNPFVRASIERSAETVYGS
jgi:uncharacterized protein